MAELYDLLASKEALDVGGPCYHAVVQAQAIDTQDDFSRTRPFVKWAGGKRILAPKLAAEIIAAKPKLYIEPFLGGGAVALALPLGLPKILSDVNPHLIDCWLCFQKIPGALYSELEAVTRTYGDGKESYLKAREEFNSMILNPRRMWAHRSALFLYLNARCFNGLWRTNARGAFNVPHGDMANPRVFTADEVSGYSLVLSCCELFTDNFVKLLGSVYAKHVNRIEGDPEQAVTMLEGIALYADPPYDGTFDGYAKSGFNQEDQSMLAGLLASFAKAGAAVWTTNADTPFIRNAYSWAQIEEISEHHSVGATGERRGKRGCLLIRGGAACQ